MEKDYFKSLNSRVFRNAIYKKQILFGPMNMSYYEVRTKYGIKKIITLGEIHTDSFHQSYDYDIKKFVKDVFQKGLERKKCVDFFLEEGFAPRKDQFGKVRTSEFPRQSVIIQELQNTMGYTRKVFKDCHTSEGDCIIDGKKYSNVRYHMWDLRLGLTPTCMDSMNKGTSNLYFMLAHYYQSLRDKFHDYLLNLIYWLLDLLDDETSSEFLSTTYELIHIYNNKNDKLVDCDYELLLQVRRLIRKQLPQFVGLNRKDFNLSRFKKDLASYVYKKVIQTAGEKRNNYGTSMLILTDIYLFLRMFKRFNVTKKRFDCDNQEHANHIILYAGDAHTHNINHLIEEFYGKESLVYQTHIIKNEQKYVIMDPSYNKYDRITIKNVDDLIERFIS